MAQRFKREILPATEDRPQIELVRVGAPHPHHQHAA